MDADIDTKHRIRNEMALALNIAATRISLLQIERTRTEARRLLSLAASFTVESQSRDASREIESRLSAEKLNNVLKIASNGTLTASNLAVRRSDTGPVDSATRRKDNLTPLLVYGAVAVVLLGLFALSLYCMLRNPKTNSVPKQSLQPGGFDISVHSSAMYSELDRMW